MSIPLIAFGTPVTVSTLTTLLSLDELQKRSNAPLTAIAVTVRNHDATNTITMTLSTSQSGVVLSEDFGSKDITPLSEGRITIRRTTDGPMPKLYTLTAQTQAPSFPNAQASFEVVGEA